MPSDPKRRDHRPKQNQAVELVESGEDEAGGDEYSYSQPRAGHPSKRPQKPPHGNIIINGDVHIKNLKDFNLIQGSKDEQRRQWSSNPVRNPHRRLQHNRATTRSAAECDSPSTSADETLSPTNDSELENVPSRNPSRRPPHLSSLLERPRSHSDRKKRYQTDEGYHTSGTVSAYTAQISGKGKGKEREKVKERPLSSVGSSSSDPRLSSGSRKSRARGYKTDATSCHSEGEHRDESSAEEDNSTEQNRNGDDEEASDDDFAKLPIHIGNPKNFDIPGIGENAILDTGTKEDWISQHFYDEIRRNTGVRSTKLTPEELKTQYRDFNGKKFQPTSKVDLMIQTDEFKGPMKFRRMQFFVASKATFTILFGRGTIRKHDFLVRSKLDTEGEEVLIGVHGEQTEAQKAEVKRKKEEQKKLAQQRKKIRDGKTENIIRQKENTRTTSPSKVAAHLATTVPRKTQSPPKNSPRQSSSSMEGTW